MHAKQHTTYPFQYGGITFGLLAGVHAPTSPCTVLSDFFRWLLRVIYLFTFLSFSGSTMLKSGRPWACQAGDAHPSLHQQTPPNDEPSSREYSFISFYTGFPPPKPPQITNHSWKLRSAIKKRFSLFFNDITINVICLLGNLNL